MSSTAVYSNELNQSFKEFDLATTYVQCALFADISNIPAGNPLAISGQDAKSFRILALNHWRKGNKLAEVNENGDDEIVSFSTFLSSQESVTWDHHPEMNKIKNDGSNPAASAYANANCGLLLEAAK